MSKTSIFIHSILIISLITISSIAYSGNLAPASFNDMYNAASSGKIGILKEAVNRGMNIDFINEQGDTGICVAIKNWDYRAYNSFRAAGAQSKPYCINEIPADQIQTFMASSNIPEFFKEDFNAFYIEKKGVPWGWVVGSGVLVVALAAIIM